MDSSSTESPDPTAAAASTATMGAAAQKAGDRMVAASKQSGVEIKKLVVAIHGIGDQYRQATIQSVVTQFGHHFDFPATVPLGSFYALPGQISAFTLKTLPKTQMDLASIGFVEAYWADIPRRVQRRGYTIQESKAWARTIVERVRARYGDDAESVLGFQRADFLSASTVLEEMIDTIAVLGNLLFLAEKAGILKFDLDTMLTSYLGDVQIVADFANYRAQILAQFNEVVGQVFDTISKEQAPPEIHIIAHSEGTVVAFMALLQAMCLPTDGEAPPPARPAWIEHVRGFMTIGSPIDKHIVLWPDIWNAVKTPGDGPAAGRIHWRNYYDYGDPVGFELDTTRLWLSDEAHNWDQAAAFEFQGPDAEGNPRDDFGFSRYYLPGAAHNDYWTDPAVFGHFIRTVIGLDPHPDDKKKFTEPPGNRWTAQVSSYVLPYLLAVGILASGVYLLFKGLRGFLTNEQTRNAFEDCLLVLWIKQPVDDHVPPIGGLLDVVLNVTGITCLLMGMTLVSRIPRLTRSAKWQRISIGLFVGFGFLYVILVDAPRRSWLGFHAVGNPFHPSEATIPTAITLGLAVLTCTAAVWGGRMRAWGWLQPWLHGMRPLLIPGCATVTGIVGYRLFREDQTVSASLWPLLLGGAAFTYLWWLAALIFDLVFVWHRYIRSATLQTHLRRLTLSRQDRERLHAEGAPPATPAANG